MENGNILNIIRDAKAKAVQDPTVLEVVLAFESLYALYEKRDTVSPDRPEEFKAFAKSVWEARSRLQIAFNEAALAKGMTPDQFRDSLMQAEQLSAEQQAKIASARVEAREHFQLCPPPSSGEKRVRKAKKMRIKI